MASKFIITFIIMQLIFLCLRYKFKIIELGEEIGKLQNRYNTMETTYLKWMEDFIDANNESYRKMQHEIKNIPKNIPKDVISAVKYAVKMSHPDNGGNAEDFKRFQATYESLKKK